MARCLTFRGRILQLTWKEPVFTFRLLEGKTYITPKLELTVQDLLKLFRSEPLEIGEWISFHRMDELEFYIQKKEWDRVRWLDFYRLAKEERPPDPLEGWDS